MPGCRSGRHGIPLIFGDLGEVLIADGEGGGFCFPAGLIWVDRFEESTSCPCDMLAAISRDFTWIEVGTIECTATGTDVPGKTDGAFLLEHEPGGVLGTDSLFISQEWDQKFTKCVVQGDDFIFSDEFITGGNDVEDCFDDLQAVAIALGVSCPAPPHFVPNHPVP